MRRIAKNQQHDEMYNFCTPNQGWEIAFGAIGVKKTLKFNGFAKKTRIANAQIAAISNRSDFKSRDADLKLRDAGQLRHRVSRS